MCHPERSEGSALPPFGKQIPRFARDDISVFSLVPHPSLVASRLPPPQPRRRLELLNIKEPPPTHDQLHLPQLADILRRFAVDDNQIRNLALLDRPVVLVVLHHPRRRDRGHLENKRGGEAGPL